MKKGIFVLTVAVLTAIVSLTPAAITPARAADAVWTAEYWNNVKLKGTPVLVRDEDKLSHDWGIKSPLSGTVNTDKFSVRWTTTASFEAGTYYFRASSDDGLRVWIDGVKVVDQWSKHVLQSAAFVKDMSAGDHDIRVEYYEDVADASVSFNWWDTATDAWTVRYYNGTALKGKVIVNRPETMIKNYWNATSPAPGVKANNFSARWTGTVTTETAKYKFKVTANGGFRLWVDNKLVLDEWYDHTGTTSTAAVKMTEGEYTVKLEYYNHKKPAVLILGISQN